MPYVLKNTFLPSYWEGLGGKMAIKNNASTGTPKAIGQKRRKTRENKASSTQISQRGFDRLNIIFEVVLNFTNYVIGISSGHLVFVEV